MPYILTVTLNPALDISASAPVVRPQSKIRCSEVMRHPGGGGINVARVLHRLGAQCTALCLLGGPTGELLAELLQQEGVAYVAVPLPGHTRESFTVQDIDAHQEYRFVMPGPHIEPKTLQEFLSRLAQQAAPEWLVVSGSLPPGISADIHVRLAELAANWGANLLVDGSGESLRQALQAGLFLAKPSVRELRELAGVSLPTLGDVRQAAHQWIERGWAKVVVVSLGAKGALLVAPDYAKYAPALPVHAISAVGAGDSFVAGMVWALSQEMALDVAFSYGVASASAAVIAPGTALSAVADIHRLHAQVQLQDVADAMPL